MLVITVHEGAVLYGRRANRGLCHLRAISPLQLLLTNCSELRLLVKLCDLRVLSEGDLRNRLRLVTALPLLRILTEVLQDRAVALKSVLLEELGGTARTLHYRRGI